MSTPRFLSALLLLPAVAFAAANTSDIEFNGVVVTTNAAGKDKVEVSLLNRSTGNTKWVTLGGKFDGLVLTGYDDKGLKPMTIPSIVLTRDSAAGLTKQTVTIALKQASILSTGGNEGGQNANVILTTATSNTGTLNVRNDVQEQIINAPAQPDRAAQTRPATEQAVRVLAR